MSGRDGPLGPPPRRRWRVGGRRHDPVLDGPVDAIAAPVDDVVAGRARPSLRQALVLVRMAVGQVAIQAIQRRHRIAQVVLLLSVVVAGATGRWAIAALFAVLALAVFLVIRLVVRAVERVSIPRQLREALEEAEALLRAVLDALGLPTGPISGARFALRLARRGSRQAMVASVVEAAELVIPVLTASTTSACAALVDVLGEAEPGAPGVSAWRP